MFCHGREALRRNAFQMYQTIFKNVVFGLADFFFAFLSVFAATDLFNPWLKQLYNVLYTCIPVVLFTVFDRQLPYDVLFQTPVLYPAFSSTWMLRHASSRTLVRATLVPGAPVCQESEAGRQEQLGSDLHTHEPAVPSVPPFFSEQARGSLFHRVLLSCCSSVDKRNHPETI